MKWISAQAVLAFVVGFSFPAFLQAAVPLHIGQNFQGSRFGPDSDASPADGDGAAGPQHFVEFINGRYSVYDKSTGTRVQTMTDLRFWNAAGINFASTVGTTDPRIIYDIYSQRWFASMVDFTVNRPNQRSNHFLLAVSSTSDPTGKWTGFTFGSDTNNLDFADFPTLGVDTNGVYLSGDMFDRLGNPVGPTIVAIPKASLLTSPPTLSGLQRFGPLTYTSRGDIVQPAVTIGNPSPGEVAVAVGDLGIDFQPHTTLILSTLFSNTNAFTLSSPPTVLDVPAYTVPINPPQPDGSDNLDNGDARFGSMARRVNDTLYVTHAVEVDNRAAVRWYVIDAVNHSLVQSGTITDTNLDLFYPSIAANEAGTVVIACNGSSPTNFVSSYAAVGQLTNATLTFGPLTLLQTGSGSYQNPDASGTSRWGDYSATTVDPADSNRFWTLQMIPVSASAWATQITELITGNSSTNSSTNSVTLTATRSGNNVIISWPSSAGGQLQFTPTLNSAGWASAPQSVTTTNGVDQVVVPISGTNAFYRVMPSTSGGTGG